MLLLNFLIIIYRFKMQEVGLGIKTFDQKSVLTIEFES